MKSFRLRKQQDARNGDRGLYTDLVGIGAQVGPAVLPFESAIDVQRELLGSTKKVAVDDATAYTRGR